MSKELIEQLVKRVEMLEQRLQRIQPIVDMHTPFGPQPIGPTVTLSPEQKSAITDLGKKIAEAMKDRNG
jgi:hypothetical protein